MKERRKEEESWKGEGGWDAKRSAADGRTTRAKVREDLRKDWGRALFDLQEEARDPIICEERYACTCLLSRLLCSLAAITSLH